MNLKRRLALMERKLRPGELAAIIEGHFDHDRDGFVPIPLVDEDDPRLRDDVDEYDEALISRWWFVWFLEGTKDQQNARLKQLRRNTEYQKPFENGELPLRYEGGAVFEDGLIHVQEQEENLKRSPLLLESHSKSDRD